MLITAVVGCGEPKDASSDPTSSDELSADVEDAEDEEEEDLEEDSEEEDSEEDFEEDEEEDYDEEPSDEEEDSADDEDDSADDEEETEEEDVSSKEEPVSSDVVSKEDVSSKEPEQVESEEDTKAPEANSSSKPASSKTDKPASSKTESKVESKEPASSEPVSSESQKEELTPEEIRLEKLFLGEDEEFNKDAVYSEGNLSRLAKAMRKSKNGETVTIVFYGNSANTALNGDGGKADRPYVNLIKEWWAENIGPCHVIKSGLEHLTSVNACMRVDFDVLDYKPDVVFLDFAVQDAVQSASKTNARGFDNLVNLILGSETSPAVLTLLLTGAEQITYSMNPDNASMFTTASSLHKEVSKWYDIPVIDFEKAVWDNFTELVKVTTKKEIPLISWKSIALNNVNMNNDGHMVLAGAIKNFLGGVFGKLDTISTTIPAMPAETCFGVTKYMNGSFMPVSEIMDGKAEGYKFSMDSLEMDANSYKYVKRSDTGTTEDSMVPYIRTYRHYVPADDSEAEQKLSTNTKYLELTRPAVTNPETYFWIYSSMSVSTKGISNKNILSFAPVSLFCYGEDGKLISQVKASCSTFNETTNSGKTTPVKVPVGTTKIVFKMYTKGGQIRLLGFGEFQ